ncbi:hypothetical protein Afe04nite_39950 [Asanoa ferruginea]|nr:hypothetical protein Afe04nite_39950 [Asanoa ferruginea]
MARAAITPFGPGLSTRVPSHAGAAVALLTVGWCVANEADGTGAGDADADGAGAGDADGVTNTAALPRPAGTPEQAASA